MPQTIVNTKFYLYEQNNSGGDFKEDNHVSYRVLIEALNEKHADQIALDIGIYFNGVSEGIDCRCCGNRWHPAMDAYSFDSVADYLSTNPGSNWFDDCKLTVYHLDGSKEQINI